MAEVINEIIGKEAFAQIERMEKGLNGLVDTFVKSTNAAKLLEATLSDTKGVGATTQAIKDLNKAQQQNETILKKIAIAESEQGKIMAENAVRLQALNTANKNAARENLANEGSVNKLSASLIKYKLQWDAMSESLRKSPLGVELNKRITSTDAALKQLDASTGRFQRNVGDYKNQLFGLTQVFRELPGFTYSAQTGILGLSNNLPILADNFKSVAAATNEATGKVNGTMGALKIFASSIFSFGNIFAIAIGLFTIFSKQIFALFESTEKLNKEEEKFIKLKEKTNGTMLEEIAHGKVLLDVLNDMNLSNQQRGQAYDDLNKLYPHLLDNMEKEDVLANGLNDSYIQILNSITLIAKKKAQMALLESLIADQVKIQTEIDTMLKPKDGEFIYFTDYQLQQLQSRLSMVNDKIKTITNSMRLAAETEAESFILSGGKKPPKNKSTNGGNTRSNRNKPAKTNEDLSYSLGTSNIGYTSSLDMFASDESTIAMKSEELRKRFQKYMDQNPINVNINLAVKDNYIDVELMDQLAQSVQIASDVLSTISDARYNKEIEQIDRRSKAIEESYNLEKKQIEQSGISQEQKAKKLANLEARKAAQDKQIERDRKIAAQKAAQYEKALTIANIITAGALAIIKQEVATPLPAGAVAVGLVAASVAAQLARAIATPLPSYAKGTDNHPGGLAEVGENGVELGILPSGQKFLTPATSTIMDLPAQTKIIPHEKLMEGVYNVAFKKLANGDKVSTDSMQVAMLDAFSEMTNEMKGIKNEIKNQKLGVNMYGDMEHLIRMKKIIS